VRLRACITICVAMFSIMTGEGALGQKKPQASQTVDFNVRMVRQVSIPGQGSARIFATISTRGTTKVTVGPPRSHKAGSPFQRQLVILSSRADSLFSGDTAPPFEGEAVYTITE